MEAFKADIKNSDLIRDPKSNATELTQQCDSVLTLSLIFTPRLLPKRTSPNFLTRG